MKKPLIRTPILYDIIPTPVGPVGVVWEEKPSLTIHAIHLPPNDKHARLQGAAKSFNKKIQARILNCFTKSRKQPPTVAISFVHLTPFRKKVLEILASEIPRGKVVSYDSLARLSGHANAARAVGGAMKANRVPLLIPCHRTVAKDGTLGGFMGKQKGLALKRKLLEREGVRFDKAGKILPEFLLK